MLDYLGRIPELDNSDMLLQVHDIYSSLKSLQCNLMFRTLKKEQVETWKQLKSDPRIHDTDQLLRKPWNNPWERTFAAFSWAGETLKLQLKHGQGHTINEWEPCGCRVASIYLTRISQMTITHLVKKVRCNTVHNLVEMISNLEASISSQLNVDHPG
jgi:hypothetical protein